VVRQGLDAREDVVGIVQALRVVVEPEVDQLLKLLGEVVAVPINPAQGQPRVVLEPLVLAFPVVVEEVVQEVRLRLLLARQEQTEAVEVAARMLAADSVGRAAEAAQEIPAVVLAGTPMDKAGQAVF
jgi:hypothetical protein